MEAPSISRCLTAIGMRRNVRFTPARKAAGWGFGCGSRRIPISSHFPEATQGDNAAMQTKRNSLIVSGILVVAFLGLGAGCTRGTSAPEVGAAGHIGPASLRAKASELQGTIVSAHLEE